MEQPKIWDYVLGETAEVNNIANNVVDESSGSPSFRSLYPEITGIPIADGGIPVKRKDINALFKIIGEQIFFIQRGGTYQWDYDATYPKDAIVVHNGEFYRSLSENTSRDPSVDTTTWKPLVEVKPEDLENIQVDDGSLLSKGIVQLTNEISDDETLAVTPKAVKNVLDQLNELINNFNDANTALTALQGTVGTNTNEIASLKAKDIQLDTKLSDLESLIGDGSEIDLSGIQNQIDELKAKDTQIEQTISDLNIGSIPQDIEDLKASDNTQNANITELQTNTTNLNNTVSQLSSTVDGYQGSIDQATTNADLALETAQGLNSTVGNNTSDISNLKTNLQNLTNDYGELTDNLVGVYKYSSDYEFEPNDIVYDNNVFYECIQTSEGNPLTNTDYFKKIEDQSLIDRLVTLETDSTTYGSDISALNTRVQALENGSGSQDLTEIETRLSTAETNISSLQSADVTLSDRITALENGSGGSTSSVSYQHYVQFGMFGEGEGSASDYSQNDWTIDYLATGQAVKSITTNSGNTLLTIDLDGRYDVKSFRLDVKSDFLNAGGYVRLTIDGVEQTFYNCRYNPVGFCCLGAVFGAGVGGTILMVHRDATDPTRLQYNPVSVGQGLSFFFKL